MAYAVSVLEQDKPALQPLAAMPYALLQLDLGNVDSILDLQSRVSGDNTIQRDKGYLSAHFNNGHSALGVLHGSKLVGHALMTQDVVYSDQSVNHAPALSYTQNTISMFLIDPEHAGKGLGSRILQAWEAAAKATGADVLHARVKASNQAGYKRFNKMGLETQYQAPSPDDAQRIVSYMYKSL